MINKEFIVSSDGSIYKDFIDRNIPQNSNNQVSVNVLIPASCFTGLSNYAVLLAVSRIISGVETTLNTLVMSASKSITIDGVLYVKYSAYLTIGYTNKLGQLKVSPYIQTTTTTTNSQNESVEVVSIQQAFTNTTLNVIKSIAGQFDASLEDAEVVEIIEGQINAKKIYTFIDTESASVGEHYYNLANSYDPNASQFSGCLVLSVYGGWTNAYIPYLNNGHVELLEIIETGMFYKISDVSYANSTYTYTRTKLSYSKSEVDSIESGLQTQINQKVDKTQKVNGHALSGDITITKGDVGLGNVENYGVESTPTASGINLYITSKGVYDALKLVYTAISGCATDEDLTTINNRLNAIESVIGDGTDDDNVINTLYEVIQVLNGLGEGANLLDLINAKANQSDLTTLQGSVNSMSAKVDILYDSNHNAYAEITANDGITIETTDWVSNVDENYPYKFVLTNGYFTGATNVIVVFDKDSDTSLLSTTTEIDEVNGTITLYATDLPSADIVIEKIAVFNSVNAYVLYNQTLVSQVNANTQAISDINNTKLPQYTIKEKTIGNFTASLEIVDGGTSSPNFIRPQIEIKKDATHKAQIYAYGNKNISDNDVYGVSMSVQNGSNLAWVEMTQDLNVSIGALGGGQASIQVGTHSLTFDANGDLKVDGNAVGGGSQLYQHNIWVRASRSSYKVCGGITIINDSDTQFTASSFLTYLGTKGNTGMSSFFTNVSGFVYIGQNYCLLGVAKNSSGDLVAYGTNDGSSIASESFSINNIGDFQDKVIAL